MVRTSCMLSAVAALLFCSASFAQDRGEVIQGPTPSEAKSSKSVFADVNSLKWTYNCNATICRTNCFNGYSSIYSSDKVSKIELYQFYDTNSPESLTWLWRITLKNMGQPDRYVQIMSQKPNACVFENFRGGVDGAYPPEM